jgi:hypothetical protein
MQPLSRRLTTLVALVVALVFLLSGCPGGGGDTGGGGYSISSGSAEPRDELDAIEQSFSFM